MKNSTSFYGLTQNRNFSSTVTFKSFLSALFLLLSASLSFGQTTTFNTPGATTWTAPTGVTSVIIECWGGGGAGGGTSSTNGVAGGGGGGGAYTKSTLAVVPGTTYN